MAGARRGLGLRRGELVLADRVSLPTTLLAATLLKQISSPSTILAWELSGTVCTLPPVEEKQAYGCGFGRTQTAPSSVGVLAAAPLAGSARWCATGVCRPL